VPVQAWLVAGSMALVEAPLLSFSPGAGPEASAKAYFCALLLLILLCSSVCKAFYVFNKSALQVLQCS
jgi:hypothetical protein